MLKKLLVLYSCFCITSSLLAANNLYCAQTSQYIRIGMSPPDVLQICGEPQNIQKTKKPLLRQEPISQWIFNVANNSSGSQPYMFNSGQFTRMTLTVKNNRITKIIIAGETVQSAALCGTTIAVGDSPAGAQYNCGDPSLINNTYENINTGQTVPIEVWSYKSGNYGQAAFQLTFVDNVLTEIRPQ